MFPSAESLDLDAVTVHQPRIPYADGKVDWAQDTETVQIFLNVPAVKGRDLLVNIKPQSLEVGLRGGTGCGLLAGSLGGRCDPSDSEWELMDGELKITLKKALMREWPVPLRMEKLPSAVTTPATVHGASSPAPSADALPSSSKRRVPIADESTDERRATAVEGKAAVSHASSAGRSSSSVGGVSKASNSGLGNKYREWDRFDDVSALMGIENEGKSKDEPGFTMRASKGIAAMQCTDYVKDREEVELDQDLDERRTSLQQTINGRLVQAAELKQQGNALLKRGEAEGALVKYLEGESVLEVAENAKVILSARLSTTLDELLRDLRSNAAQAALNLEDWETAISVASAVLDAHKTHPKALYRRAMALIRRNEREADARQARADLKLLLHTQPQNSAARALLDSIPHEDVKGSRDVGQSENTGQEVVGIE